MHETTSANLYTPNCNGPHGLKAAFRQWRLRGGYLYISQSHPDYYAWISAECRDDETAILHPFCVGDGILIPRTP